MTSSHACFHLSFISFTSDRVSKTRRSSVVHVRTAGAGHQKPTGTWCLQFDINSAVIVCSVDEALQRQERIWQQEVDESLSVCTSLSHPSRPRHIDFLWLTAVEDDVSDTTTPLPPDVHVSRLTLRTWVCQGNTIICEKFSLFTGACVCVRTHRKCAWCFLLKSSR